MKQSKPRPDALYVKLKDSSKFTVNRETVEGMARQLGQDTTFVTHFALARLRDDIQAGRLDDAAAVPVATEWMGPAQVDLVRADVQSRFNLSSIAWEPHAQELAEALSEM